MKLLQIMPADGWKAAYYDEENQAWGIEPLVGWALADDGCVIGLLAASDAVVTVDDDAAFLTYIRPDGPTAQERHEVIHLAGQRVR